VSKPRREDKKERYLFERPSVPPRRRRKDIPIQDVIRMILKKLKKLERVRKRKRSQHRKWLISSSTNGRREQKEVWEMRE
jgi:hypothetical protein